MNRLYNIFIYTKKYPQIFFWGVWFELEKFKLN